MNVVEQEIKSAISKKQKMLKLLDNDFFKELIIDDFINNGIKENVIDGNLDSAIYVDQLKARQILHKFLYDIITTGETLEARKN